MAEYAQVKVPGPYASRSKMQSKGWKCWAKRLDSVRTPASSGYDYEGEFLAVDAVVELALGDVVLHVDDSSGAQIGVVTPKADGEAQIVWIEEASGKWAGVLAPAARKVLALSAEDRIRHAARVRAEQLKEMAKANRKVEAGAIEHYEALAAGGPDLRTQAIAQIKEMMAQFGITLEDLQ